MNYQINEVFVLEGCKRGMMSVKWTANPTHWSLLGKGRKSQGWMLSTAFTLAPANAEKERQFSENRVSPKHEVVLVRSVMPFK